MGTFKDLNLYEIPYGFKFFEDNLDLSIEMEAKCSRSESNLLSKRLALQHFNLEKMHEKIILQKNGDLLEWRKKYQRLFSDVLKKINDRLSQRYALKTILAYRLNLHLENKEVTKEIFLCYIGIAIVSILFSVFSGCSLKSFLVSFFCFFSIAQLSLMIAHFSLKDSTEEEKQELQQYLALQHARTTLLEVKKVFQEKASAQNKQIASNIGMGEFSA